MRRQKKCETDDIVTLSKLKGTPHIWSWIFDEDVDFDDLEKDGKIRS